MSQLLETVSITNYKSIARCRVTLGPLTFLVGPNGSGKSNFLDAIRFVSDALNTTLENALRDRGGIQSVRRRSRGHPTHFGIRLDFKPLGPMAGAFYAFKVGAERDGAFSVQREEYRSWRLPAPGEDFETHFVVEEGRLTSASREIPTVFERDRLALVALAGLPEFRPVYDSLVRMGFYNLNPQRIRDLQDPDPGHLLARDGRNLAAVIRELGRGDGGRILNDVREHLQAVLPGVVSIEHKAIGPKETIEFRQKVAGDDNLRRFLAENMSDGTLRALGILVAAFQGAANGRRRISLVAVEEPEMALHPGATEVVAVALMLASETVQVLATTHSPDLLSHKDISDRQLLAVSADSGNTLIAPVDAATRSAIRDRLYSAGELLAQGQIVPDEEFAAKASQQLRLFSTGDD